LNDAVEVRLSAHQDHVFQGKITLIRPLVNFSLGGPETNRPIRPLGTGAPEWPSTFSVRVSLEDSEHLVVPGLTGYATVVQKRNVLAVPRGTVNAVSGNRGIAFVIGSDGESFAPRNVVTGIKDGGWVEIREGLQAGERVIADGHQVLQPGDRIVIQGAKAPESDVDEALQYLSSRPALPHEPTDPHSATDARAGFDRQDNYEAPLLSGDQATLGKGQQTSVSEPEE